MPAIVVVGAQWGDEGKGKTTDILGTSVDYVVKPNGGNNAGHTVVVGGEKYELKLLPAGILSPNVTPVIGNGVVVNLEALFEEIDALESRGADTSKPRISANAHLVAPYHQTLDKVTERFLGKRAIGTTGRGIGPAYMDKIGRLGIRVQDIFDESILRQKIEGSLHQKNELLVKVYNRRAVSVEEVVDYFLPYVERRAPLRRRDRAHAQRRPRPGRRRRHGGRSGDDARRRPRHVPVRHVLEPDRRRFVRGLRDRPDADQPRRRHRQGLHDPRGRRTLPDRALRRDGRIPAEGRRRVRRQHRTTAPAAAGTTRSSLGTPHGSTASPTTSSRSSTSSPASSRSPSPWPTTSTVSASTRCR